MFYNCLLHVKMLLHVQYAHDLLMVCTFQQCRPAIFYFRIQYRGTKALQTDLLIQKYAQEFVGKGMNLKLNLSSRVYLEIKRTYTSSDVLTG